jgi:hypothetical protein
VPGKASFSRALAFLSEQGILEQILDGIASMAREKAGKKAEEKAPKAVKVGKKYSESP